MPRFWTREDGVIFESRHKAAPTVRKITARRVTGRLRISSTEQDRAAKHARSSGFCFELRARWRRAPFGQRTFYHGSAI